MNYFFKSKGNRGLFDTEFNNDKLNSIGNPLARLNQVIDFGVFRERLEQGVLNQQKKSKAGARPYDPILMFKICLIQKLYGLSDKDTEYQIIDRCSFKEFLGLSSGDKVPDEKTIWSFREQLVRKDVVSELFTHFYDLLASKGMILNEGKIVDASFMEAPKQRNLREENIKIKANEGTELWNDKPNKKRHKDIDARWTKKNKQTHFGYKNHVIVDAKSKFIEGYVVTDASVHDSQALDDLLAQSERGQELFADSAYTGPKQESVIAKYEMKNRVHEKGKKGQLLNEKQKKSNRKKSSIRARVEHVFGYMEQTMKGLKVRTIGLERAFTISGLYNLAYNLCRYEQVVRLKLIPIQG
jgi:IS5 family transposase